MTIWRYSVMRIYSDVPNSRLLVLLDVGRFVVGFGAIGVVTTDHYFLVLCFFVKQKTAYEMRISDWSSDVCSSDLRERQMREIVGHQRDIGGLERDVRTSGPHGDAHRRIRDGRCIIDAIPDHRDRRLGAELFDCLDLVLGHQ